MKIRNGFVSNSSSSSFIIKKAVLSEVQLIILKSFVRGNSFCTNEIEKEDDDYVMGQVEAHNRSWGSDADENSTFNTDMSAFEAIIDEINARDNVILRYEDSVCPNCFIDPKCGCWR